MSENLYTILDEYKQIEYELMESGGDLTPELEERLAINKDQFEEKMDNYAKLRNAKLARIESIKSELERLSSLIELEQRGADELSKRMKDALMQYGEQDKKGIYRFSTTLFNFSTRKSTGYTYNEDKIPAKFWYTPPPKEPVPIVDKSKIKDALKDGDVEGVTVNTNYSITIK